MKNSNRREQTFNVSPQNQDDYFDFSKLTNENFWQEILHHSLQAFIYTIRKFWYLFVLTSIGAFIVAEIIYSMQVDKYHLNMTLRYGSIKNGLANLSSGGGSIGVGSDIMGLGAVESFGKNFDGIPTPKDTENNFGLNLKDFLVIIRGKFVSRESFKEKFRSKKAKVTSFDAKKASSLASLTATGANRQEVLGKAKELSDYLENLFLERKRSIVEKIDERLNFSREEYDLILKQIKHIKKLEKEFGRTSEIMARKNTLLTQELSVRASLSEILSFKGDNYIKDFEILNVSISPTPRKFLGRTSILIFVLMISTIMTSIGVVLLVFFRLKKITAASADIKDSQQDIKNDKKTLGAKSQQTREDKKQAPPKQTKEQIKKKNLSNAKPNPHNSEVIKKSNENSRVDKKGSFYQSTNRKKGKD